MPEKIIKHYGTKGMQWGVRKDKIKSALARSTAGRSSKERKKIATNKSYAKSVVSSQSNKAAVAAGLISGLIDAAFGGSYMSAVVTGLGAAATAKVLSTAVGSAEVYAIRNQEKDN